MINIIYLWMSAGFKSINRFFVIKTDLKVINVIFSTSVGRLFL